MLRYQYLLCVLLVWVCLCAGASAQTLPQLRQSLAGRNSPEAQARLLNRIAQVHLLSLPDSAFTYAKRALKIAETRQLTEEQAYSYRLIGQVFYHKGAFDYAIAHLLKALACYKQVNSLPGEAETYKALGLAYQYVKQYQTAHKNYQAALRTFGSLKHAAGTAGVLSALGHLAEKQQQYQQALAYQHQALAFYQDAADSLGLAKAYADLGSIYEDQSVFDSAKLYFHAALNYNLAVNNRVGAVIDLNNLGDVLQKSGEVQASLPYFFRSLALARELHQPYQLRSVYRDIAQTYHLLGQAREAYLYLDSAYVTYGEVLNAETAKQTAGMQVIFETQEKDKEIALLESNKKFNNLLVYSVSGGAILLLALGTLVLSRQRLLIKRNRQLYHADLALQQSALANLQLNELQLKTEIEVKQLKAAKLQDELYLRNRELASQTLTIAQKNEILSDILEKVQIALRKQGSEKDKALQQLVKLITQTTQAAQNWQAFDAAFGQIHGDFYANLERQYPDLTAGDLRLCALIRLNIAPKEMAAILGISQDSLRVNRHRLRKKLGLSQSDNLTGLMMQF